MTRLEFATVTVTIVQKKLLYIYLYYILICTWQCPKPWIYNKVFWPIKSLTQHQTTLLYPSTLLPTSHLTFRPLNSSNPSLHHTFGPINSLTQHRTTLNCCTHQLLNPASHNLYGQINSYPLLWTHQLLIPVS